MFGNKNQKRDLEVFAMHDNQTNQYNLPSFFMNEHEARRAMERFLMDPRNADQPSVTHCQHFSLFRIGYYDRATGQLEQLAAPVNVLNLHELKAFLETQKKAGQLSN